MSTSERIPKLPHIGGAGTNALSERAYLYFNIRDALATLVAAAALSCVAGFIPDQGFRVLAWGGILVLTVSSLFIELPWLNRVQVRATSYTVTADYIYVARGWLWRRTVLIATPQVLNVDIVQGPLLRALGVVSVRFTCITEIERLGPLDPTAAESARRIVLASQTDVSDE